MQHSTHTRRVRVRRSESLNASYDGDHRVDVAEEERVGEANDSNAV
jgi:hypothetical protein